MGRQSALATVVACLGEKIAAPAVLSFGLALVGTVVLALAPLGSRQEATPAGQGAVGRVERVSLLQHEGASVLAVLAVPPALAAIGAVAGGRPLVRATSAVFLVAFVVFGLLSIGVFYAPSAAAMVVASLKTKAPDAVPP